jgi:hypothetical protein
LNRKYLLILCQKLPSELSKSYSGVCNYFSTCFVLTHNTFCKKILIQCDSQVRMSTTEMKMQPTIHLERKAGSLLRPYPAPNVLWVAFSIPPGSLHNRDKVWINVQCLMVLANDVRNCVNFSCFSSIITSEISSTGE